MLASYFYQGDVPEPETLLDMARQTLVAESNSDGALDPDVCRALVDGLAKAWSAARQYADEDWEGSWLNRREAEVLYRKVALRAYVSVVRRTFPDYDCEDGDGVIWWPEGLTERDGWPKEFVTKLAATLGEIEGDRTVVTYRYMQKLDAEKKAAEARS